MPINGLRWRRTLRLRCCARVTEFDANKPQFAWDPGSRKRSAQRVGRDALAGRLSGACILMTFGPLPESAVALKSGAGAIETAIGDDLVIRKDNNPDIAERIRP